MIVLDASAAWELLRQGPAAQRLMALVLGPGASIHAPDLINVEVLHVLRQHAQRGEVPVERSEEMRRDFADLPVHVYPTWPLLGRAWELRANFTAYDAMYVALAEVLDASLVTADLALAGATRDHTSVAVETVM